MMYIFGKCKKIPMGHWILKTLNKTSQVSVMTMDRYFIINDIKAILLFFQTVTIIILNDNDITYPVTTEN